MTPPATDVFMGIDVQAARDCPYVVLDKSLTPRLSGWLSTPADAIRAMKAASMFGRVAIGIDGPRMPLPGPRQHFWGKKGWYPRRTSQIGNGRHCEIILKAAGVANPQWTRVAGSCDPWMERGFRLFESFSPFVEVYEVFPSASYAQLADESALAFTVSLGGFQVGPKDMLDAYVAAYTVHEFLAGKGVAVGGGDGLGVIILPRPLEVPDERVTRWPETSLDTPPSSRSNSESESE